MSPACHALLALEQHTLCWPGAAQTASSAAGMKCLVSLAVRLTQLRWHGACDTPSCHGWCDLHSLVLAAPLAITHQHRVPYLPRACCHLRLVMQSLPTCCCCY